MNRKISHCALVLPGGGARGAYQVGVLRAIDEIMGREASPFTVICGTSAGAINAAVVASHAHEFSTGLARLESFWSSMRCGRIYRTDALTVLASGLRWGLALASGGWLDIAPRALLDNSPLRAFLGRTLRLEGIQEAIRRQALRGLAITASGYTCASAITFFQGQADIEPWARPRRRGLRQEIGIPHLLASAALPLLFPAERVGEEYFGDGGMRMLAPMSPAIHLGADRIMVVATRDERPDPPPTRATRYPAPGEIAGYLLDTIFMDTLNADLARLERINRTIGLLDEVGRGAAQLRTIQTLVIRPSRDLREVTAAHVGDIPGAVRLLLRTLGGWGRDWRMASYLLFEAPFCRELIELGYADGLQQADAIREFLQPAS